MGKGENEDTAVNNSRILGTSMTFEKSRVSDNKVRPKEMVDHENIQMDSNHDHQQALEKQKNRREREPLLYCKLVTKWPLQSFCK